MNRLLYPILLMILTQLVQANDSLYSKFYGNYSGQIEVNENHNRDLQVEIKPTNEGFNVSWKTIKSDQSGSGKTKSYSIDFIESQRPGIYGSAMKTNLFGGQQALDPMKGEPYFWARINNSTLTVFGMLITEDGDYEIQRYDRTLNNDNMELIYTLSKGENIVRTINALLKKQP